MRAFSSRTSIRGIVAALCLGVGAACASPTVNIATEKPIEIRIDLHHEVRIQLDREVSELIDTEGARALSARGTSDDAERVRQAKAQGVVGERADGYLGVRSVGAADVDPALVERVNASRRSDYHALAEDRGLPPEAVEKLAGANRLRAANPGEAIQTPEGEWVVKDQDTTVVVTDERDDRGRTR